VKLERLLKMANTFAHCNDSGNSRDLLVLRLGAREAALHLHRGDRSDACAVFQAMRVLRTATGRRPTARDRRLFRIGFLGMLTIGRAAIASEREVQ
jgi:hypothetical protein